MKEFGGFVRAKLLTPVRTEENVLNVSLIRSKRPISALIDEGFGEKKTVEIIQGKFFLRQP